MRTADSIIVINTKTVMLRRYGMLACWNNSRETMDVKFNRYNATDNEDH